MISKIQEAAREVVRFLMKLGFSWKKALLHAAITMAAIITIATTITYFVTNVVVASFIRLYAQSSGQAVNYDLAHLIAVIMAMAIFFLMTVGLVLMVGELKNWLIKIFAVVAVVIAAGWLLKLFKPITDGHPRATALLTVTALLFALVAIAQVLGQGEALKGFSWFGKLVATIFVLWIVVLGISGLFSSKKTTRSSTATTQQHLGSSVETQYPCEFSINGNSYDGRVLGAGRFEIVSKGRRSSNQLTLGANGKGTWVQTYPKESGTFELHDPQYSSSRLEGVLYSANVHDSKQFSLTCPDFLALKPNS